MRLDEPLYPPHHALPDPGDIQVATGLPEVEEYRAAWRRARDSRQEMERKRRHLDRICRVTRRGTPKQVQIRDRVQNDYQAAAGAAREAGSELQAAEKAAVQAGPEPLARLRLSVDSYAERLRTEYVRYRHRLYPEAR